MATGRKSKAARDNPEQSKLFIEAARNAGADEGRSDADMLMGELSKMPPQPKKAGK
jgi:hypothetical protein